MRIPQIFLRAVWQWRREGKPAWWFAVGSIVLVAYGLVPTLQPTQAGEFGRVYAAYGAYFIVLSVAWGWAVDGAKPDAGDLAGAALAVAGAAVITFWPRG